VTTRSPPGWARCRELSARIRDDLIHPGLVDGSRAFRYDGYQSSDLAYAITGHSAQGATVHTGIALVTGNEDRPWLYPAMTRGTDTNLAFVFTILPVACRLVGMWAGCSCGCGCRSSR